MNVRPPCLALLLALAPLARAQEAQLAKADKAVAAWEAGDAAALGEAFAAIEAAVAHAKTAGLADTWVRRGHICRLFAANPGAAGGPADPTAEMIRSYATALERSPTDVHEATMVADLKASVATDTTAILNDLEAGQWESAYGRLARALEGRRLLGSLGADESHERAVLLRMAVQVCAYSGHVDEAKLHHEAYLALGEFDASVTVQLAKKIEAASSAGDAASFLGAIAAKHPSDSTLVSTEVALLVEAGKPAEAKKRLDAAAGQLGSSAYVQVMLGKLYAQAGAPAESRVAYEKALAADPNAVEAYVPLATFLLEDAAAAERAPNGPEGGEPTLDAARTGTYARAIELLEKRKVAAPTDKAALELLLRAYQATGDADGAARTQTALGG